MSEKKDKSFYTTILSERIAHFIAHDWDIDEAYTMTEVGERFGIGIRHARYYLMKWVDKGLLCQITIDDATYYAHKVWKYPFRALNVKVIAN